MKINYSKNFVKQYGKQRPVIKEKFVEKQKVYVTDKFNPILNNHGLGGKWLGYRSINVTGDIRAIFEEVNENYVEFVAIGTHSELYN